MSPAADSQVKPCVYVVCFAKTPYKHAKHYIGMTTLPVTERLARHRGEREGRGANLLKILTDNGGTFVLADTWDCETAEEARALELLLKRNGGTRCCSICTPGNGRGVGKGRNRHGITPRTKA